MSARRAGAAVAMVAAGAILVVLWDRQGPSQAPSLRQRASDAVLRASSALVAAQSPDGSWVSTTYGAMKDGASLTATVVKALRYLEATRPGAPGIGSAVERGLGYLQNRVRDDGSIDDGPYGMPYPVYTGGLAVLAFSGRRGEAAERARRAFASLLRQHQHLAGSTPDAPDYGGWGYGTVPPDGGQPDRHANLSATLFGIGGLWASGAGPDDPAIVAAKRFVYRCQNYPGDGGFFAAPALPVLNKAGPAANGGFRSYGSATADGIRALLAVGERRDSKRMTAAVEWLSTRFDARTHAGSFTEPREPLRNAYYYYYLWSSAHAFVRARVPKTLWADQIIEALLHRQRADGTWQNDVTDGREDDQIIATTLAIAALVIAADANRDAP